MKRLTAWILALIGVLLLPLHGLADVDQTARAEADAYFQGVFSRTKAIGGAVLVSRQGRRIYSFYWGGNDKRVSRPVDDETVYKVASVSKLVSAVGVMQLAEAKALDLDAPLIYGEGAPVRNPWYPDAPVTLRQVMSHTSSILGDAPYNAAPRWDREDVLTRRYFAKREPGSQYEYANLNGGILCSAVERASGQSFNRYMAEHIFEPLDINGAYAAHLLPDPSALSGTYMNDGMLYCSAEKYVQTDAADYDDTCAPDAHYHTSAGSLYISLSGLEKIGQVLCTGAAGEKRILFPQGAEMMRADQSRVSGSSVTGSSPYGLCVYRFEDENGVIWYGHQGRWEGLQVDLFAEPDTQTVVVMVMNGVGRSGAGGEVDAKFLRALQHISPWLEAPGLADDGLGFEVEDEWMD